MTTRFYRSSDMGAPVNSNAAGSLISILEACLVNGYGSQVATLSRSGSTVTVTVPTDHGLIDGVMVTISGATPVEYNGEYPITATGSKSYSYQIGTTPAAATGTITAKVTGSGWTRPYYVTNTAAFKQGAGGNNRYLWVSDTTTAFARVRAYESMTDINGGGAVYPTQSQVVDGMYFHKSANAAASPWLIVATEKGFIAIIHNGTSRTMHVFGDIVSNKSGDIYNTLIWMPSVTVADTTVNMMTSTVDNPSPYRYLPRAHTQLGSSINVGTYTPAGGSTMGASSGIFFSYPCPIDGAFHMCPVYVTEPNAGVRGRVTGLMSPMHNSPFQTDDIIVGTGDYAGKRYIAQRLNSGQVLIEISNTWE